MIAVRIRLTPRARRWAAAALPYMLTTFGPTATAPVVAQTQAAVPAAGASEAQAQSVTIVGERDNLGLKAPASAGALGSRSALDTPFSVTTVGQEDIAKRQATTLGQIFLLDPSVHAGEPPASTPWWNTTIRGVGVTTHYVDGVPLLMQWGGEFPLEAVERVTALKGLGGFMYGFGAPGGIFSYETKRPTDTPLLATQLGWRNHGVFSLHLDAGGRLDGPASPGYRVNLAAEHGDAYNGAGIDRQLASLAVDATFAPGVTWRAQLLHEDNRLEHEPLYFYWDLYEGDRLPEATYDYENVSVRNSYYESRTTYASTGLAWEIGSGWSLDLSLGHSRRKHFSNKMFADLLNEDGDYAGSVYNFTGDLRNTAAQALVSGSWQAGPVRHELVLGAAFQRNYEQWGNDWYWSNDFNGNLYQRQEYLVTRVPDFSLAPISYDDRQHSLFASDTLHFGAHWQAIVGLRWTDYRQLDRDGDPDVDSRYATRETTPTVALIYKPSRPVSVYASYVESLEPGSRVGDEYVNAGELLPATVSRQIELGAKAEFGAIGFSVAAFRMERASQIEHVGGDDRRTLTQDGLTLYRGLESIGSMAIGRNLRIGLGALWLDGSLERLSPDNAALQGNQPAGMSRRSAVASFEYRLASVAGLSVHGHVRHNGPAWYNDLHSVLIPGTTTAALGFQYRTLIDGRAVTLGGNVNNLFNRKYWNLDTLGERRNASLQLGVEW